jgi:hypothetical protein
MLFSGTADFDVRLNHSRRSWLVLKSNVVVVAPLGFDVPYLARSWPWKLGFRFFVQVIYRGKVGR